MRYTIARIVVELPDDLITGHFGRALEPFASAGGETHLELCSGECPAPQSDWHELDRFDFADADADCIFGADSAGYLLEMTPRDGSAPARFRKKFDDKSATTDCTPSHNPALFRFGLWIIYNLAALPHGRVAFHSSVISLGGRSVLFLGESGTGKSTHTRLWRETIAGARLLNDDSPIVGIAADGGIEVFGSPWSGKTPCYRNVVEPAAGFVRLSQAPHNRIRPLRSIEALGALLPSLPPAFAHDERLMDLEYAIVSRIIATTRVCHLECLPDGAAAELSRKTIFE